MSGAFDRVVTLLLVASAIAMAGVAVHRTTAEPPSAMPRGLPPAQTPLWEDVQASAITMGGVPGARIQIVVLTDFECPVCRGMHGILEEILSESPGDIQVSYAAYPLSYHRFARPAAMAAACAEAQGGFSSWASTVFSHQDSLGLLSWESLAVDAQLFDARGVAECATAPGTNEWIEAGLDVGVKLGVWGVPHVLMNGWEFKQPPTKQTLLDAIITVRAGRRLD